MQQRRRRSRIILGLMTLGLLAGAAVTAPPAQAQVAGPYYAEPAWDQSLPAATRFVVLTNWGSAAVLDKETGLVWERSPSSATFKWLDTSGLTDARTHCTALITGGRKGWRLPSLPELQSLIDPSVAAPGPTLPPGHPFLTVQSADYWSATTNADLPTNAWNVNFNNGLVNRNGKAGANHAWCVRGGMNADQY